MMVNLIITFEEKYSKMYSKMLLMDTNWPIFFALVDIMKEALFFLAGLRRIKL